MGVDEVEEVSGGKKKLERWMKEEAISYVEWL